MSRSASLPRMTYAQYLELERSSGVKHEYLRGEIFAMAGGSPEHARLAANVIGELRAALRGRPSAVFTSDARVRISDATEADDRGEKFAHYRRLPSLGEYLLVSQRARRLEVYRRRDDRRGFDEAGAGETLRLDSIDVTLAVDEIYRDPLAVGGS